MNFGEFNQKLKKLIEEFEKLNKVSINAMHLEHVDASSIGGEATFRLVNITYEMTGR